MAVNTTNDNSSLNMNLQEPEQAVENPQNAQEVYLGSFSSILKNNLGAYVIVEFLIGTNNLVAKEGILYTGGNNFITIYDDVNDYYIVCDLFSIKFVNMFDPRRLRRRMDIDPNDVPTYGGSNNVHPTYYYTVSDINAPGIRPQVPYHSSQPSVNIAGNPVPGFGNRGPFSPGQQ